jgi:hypothetical protein
MRYQLMKFADRANEAGWTSRVHRLARAVEGLSIRDIIHRPLRVARFRACQELLARANLIPALGDGLLEHELAYFGWSREQLFGG